MGDLLYKGGEGIFSYRVAGIWVEEGKIFLQRDRREPGLAFPGGHVSFGETQEETLKREFLEEWGLPISVGPLRWVGEIFFPWGESPCHQICFYYEVAAEKEALPRGESIPMADNPFVEGAWLPLSEPFPEPVYPPQALSLLQQADGSVQHFIYRE